MSVFAPEKVNLLFAESDSGIREVSPVIHLPLYPSLLAEIRVDEGAARGVVRDCLEARGESNDEEEIIDVVGGVEAGARSDVESKVFTFVDALKRAIVIAASDIETITDTSEMHNCKYHL